MEPTKIDIEKAESALFSSHNEGDRIIAIAQAIADERERCAKIADNYYTEECVHPDYWIISQDIRKGYASYKAED